MKKFTKGLFLLAVLFLISGCGQSKYLKEISYEEYLKKIENKETFVLEITMEGCTHCKALKPKLEKFVEENKVTVYSIDESKIKGEDLIAFKDATLIEGTPTIIFYQEGVEETVSSRLVGDVSYSKIEQKFKSNGVIK